MTLLYLFVLYNGVISCTMNYVINLPRTNEIYAGLQLKSESNHKFQILVIVCMYAYIYIYIRINYCDMIVKLMFWLTCCRFKYYH